jgi:hypothetical protein
MGVRHSHDRYISCTWGTALPNTRPKVSRYGFKSVFSRKSLALAVRERVLGASLMRTGLTKCDSVFADRSAELCQSQRNFRSEKSETRANKKAEDFSSASFRLVPSPRYFAKSNLTGAGFRFQRKR